MRVAVYLPAGHPDVGCYPDGHPQAGEPAEPTGFAYRLGRIEDGVHNHILHTGQTIPLEEFVDGLVKLARQEYPDAQIVLERLVQVDPPSPEHEKGTSKWVPVQEFDPERHTPAGAGNIKSAEINVHAGQASS